MKHIGVIVTLLLAFCGLTYSLYFAQHATSGTPNPFGIPLAEYGVLFFGILFLLAALELARALFFPVRSEKKGFSKGNIQMPPAL